jgi:hypothetical protein
MRLADEPWATRRVWSGLSSGEGLIYQVRDPVERTEPVKEKGKVTGYQTVIVDEGESDKRLLVLEPELARPLRVMSRQGNALESILRQAWDSGDLRTMTKSPMVATGTHVSMIARVTLEELLRELSDISVSNGYANRHIFVLAKRSKLLPDPEPFNGPVVVQLATQLKRTLNWAQSIWQMRRDDRAIQLWAEIYPTLFG